jgi:hypothetical protein
MTIRSVTWVHSKRSYLDHLWDAEKTCRNPHKGWYFHYLDNSLGNYRNRIEKGERLEDFPGMNHLYLRLAWSHLEPQEGVFRWEILDEIIAEYVPRGLGISFRITCLETDLEQRFATPEWVKNAGAKGEFIKPMYQPDFPVDGWLWEPDYGDPIFLEKLGNFHRQFAARYADKPWLEFIDVGSYGCWGEGHTICSSQRDWSLAVIRKHLELFRGIYPTTQIMVSDELLSARFYSTEDTPEQLELFVDWVLSQGFCLRDDSISVPGLEREMSSNHLRSPELYHRFWANGPIDIELHHYHDAVARGGWFAGKPYEGALVETRATFSGFHGSARDFLRDNPAMVNRFANELGYWYFIQGIEVPRRVKPGQTMPIQLLWVNRGLAAAYHQAELTIRLVGAHQASQQVFLPKNKGWMAKTTHAETYGFALPTSLTAGHRLEVRLRDIKTKRNLELGMCETTRRANGFYDLGGLEEFGVHIE